MEVKVLQSHDELEQIVPVLLQLRPEYNSESLILQIEKQRKDGFQLAYIEAEGKVICVAGFVMVEKLAWGKTVYIDDLVTDEQSRSKGAGKAMIDWFKSFARQNRCQQIHLDSRFIRESAHKFYEREGFSKESYHFAIKEAGS